MATAESDLVATWNVPMSNKVYKIEFEHGTTTGKRVVRVNGKDVVRHDWMFKLVGREMFEINGVSCVISIEAIGIFAYEYSLQVGGKAFEKFREQQRKALQVWHLRIGEEEMRICMEKDSLDIWVNTTKANTMGEFLEGGGTKTHFELPNSLNTSCYIKSESSGKRQIGLIHQLYVNDQLVNPSKEEDEV